MRILKNLQTDSDTGLEMFETIDDAYDYSITNMPYEKIWKGLDMRHSLNILARPLWDYSKHFQYRDFYDIKRGGYYENR